MKAKHIFLFTTGLLLSGLTYGQQAELNTVPPAQAQSTAESKTATSPPEVKATPSTSLPRKIQYSLSAGSMFAPGFGAATYFRPGIMLPVSNRLSVFGSLSVINNYNTRFNRHFSESGVPGTNNGTTQNYILNVGGNYMVNEKLNLSGSVWRDFSKQHYLPNAPINVFGNNGTSGMQFRAHYKLTENLSVSGGLRFSNGNQYNTLYQQDFMPGGF